ncbi:MAG: tetratricopeptide repeat protein [Spirochaetes bacterium]|nr:tetratricopeptide repeat protein [Spirochaetota bacterium]
MKKIFAITILVLSAIQSGAMESRELEEIIRNIVDSNVYLDMTKSTPSAQIGSDLSAGIEAAEKGKDTKNIFSFPSADEALLKSGIQLFEASLYTNSRQKLEELKSKYPDSPYRDIASIWLSRIFIELNNLNEAIDMLKSVSQESGEYPSALFITGEIYLKKGDDLRAIEYFYNVASLFHEHELADDSLVAISKLYIKNNKGNQALEAVIKLIKNYEKRETIDDAYFLMAQVFEKDAMLKDFGIAQKIYKIFIKKSEVEKAPFFYNSPLLSRAKKNLYTIESTYYSKAFYN